MSQTYEALLTHFKDIAALEQVKGILHWDQETGMPPKGAQARAYEFEALEAVIHEKRTAPQVQAWLETLNDTPNDLASQANLREIRRQVSRAQKLPKALVTELASVTSRAHHAWVHAKKEQRFAGTEFAQLLTRIIELKREEARCVRPTPTSALYDGLLDSFEPGATTQEITTLFDQLRPSLVALLNTLPTQSAELTGTFPKQAQLTLCEEVARAIGYDFSAGRMDLAPHPFCSGGVPGDVRITTRVDEASFDGCLYSVIHEVGHALYEQGINPELMLTPAGEAVSMAVHESQSRFWENQVAKSRAFMTWLHPKLTRAFPALASTSVDTLYRAINKVERTFVRTESDELTYNLHIMLRFDLERALIDGDLSTSDLEAAWNARMRSDLGLTVPNPSLGVLQDVHWSGGAFGYFPTYTLGNVYAAALGEAMQKELGPLDARVSAGDFHPLAQWLRKNVHQHGRIYGAKDLMTRACGQAVTHEPLVRHVTAKCRALT